MKNNTKRFAATLALAALAATAAAACGTDADAGTDTETESIGSGRVAGTVEQAFAEQRGPADCRPGSSDGNELTGGSAALEVARVSGILAQADISVYNHGGFMSNAIETDNPWRGVPITERNLPCIVFADDEIIVLEMTGQAFKAFIAYFDQAAQGLDHPIATEARPVAWYSPTLGADSPAELEDARIYDIAFAAFLTGRLTRSGVLDGTDSFWHWQYYERLGYFIPAAHDTR